MDELIASGEFLGTRNDRLLFSATIENVDSEGISLSLSSALEQLKKKYAHLDNGTTFHPGDRVLVAKVSGTYVVLGRIVSQLRALVIKGCETELSPDSDFLAKKEYTPSEMIDAINGIKKYINGRGKYGNIEFFDDNNGPIISIIGKVYTKNKAISFDDLTFSD